MSSPLGLTWWSEPKDEEEYDHDSVLAYSAVDKTFCDRLINYVYDQFLSFILFLILRRSTATLGLGFAHPSTLVYA